MLWDKDYNLVMANQEAKIRLKENINFDIYPGISRKDMISTAINSGFIVIALHKGSTRQLNQILVASVIFCQKGQVIIEFSPFICVSSGVIDSTSPSPWAFMSGFISHVGFGTDDWLDTFIYTCSVERQHTVHISMISDSKRFLIILDRRIDQFFKSGRSIKHGVLGMNM